jgi:hypothetical protein
MIPEIPRHFVQNLAHRLDQRLLAGAEAGPTGAVVDITLEEGSVLIKTRSPGYARSPGAQKLFLLGILISLAGCFIVGCAGVWAAGCFNLANRSVAFLPLLFGLGTCGLGALALNWSRRAALLVTEMRCSPQEICVSTIRPKRSELRLCPAQIDRVVVTDQFFVALEILVLMKDNRFHSIVSGLGRTDLERIAGVLRATVEAARGPAT